MIQRLTIVLLILFGNFAFGQELPIKPERKVRLIVGEGTNMDLDISPDGQSLVFTLVGEIFTMPASGGQAKQLTHGLALNSRPVWSAHSKFIAYTSDRTGKAAVHVMDRNGRSINFGKVAKIENLSQEIIWNRDSVVKLSGRELSGNGVKGVNQRTTADGKKVVYMSGSATKSRMDSLMVMDLFSRERRLLARLDLTNGGYLAMQRYCFSPDGKNIYIAYHGKIHKIGLEDGRDKMIPFSAKVAVDMAKLNNNKRNLSLDHFQIKYIRNVQLRADKKQLLFAALNRIYVQDLPNGQPKILCGQPFGQFQPRYSPDGRWIAYVSWQDSVKGHVWRIGSDGNGLPERLTTVASNYQHPSWSGDNSSIVFSKMDQLESHRSAIVEFYGISIADRRITKLRDSVPMLNSFGYLHNDSLMYYARRQDGDFHLLMTKSLGGAAEIIYSGKFPMNSMGDHFSDVTISPASGHVLYHHGERLYLVVPEKGKPAQLFDRNKAVSNMIIRFSRRGIDPHWEDGGKTIAWNYANVYYRLAADKVLEAAQGLSPLEGQGFIDVDIKPDRVIEIGLNVEEHYGKKSFLLTNATVITMGKPGVIENGNVLVRNGRFELVGGKGKEAPLKGIKVIDLKGKVLMPGLVDLHDHVPSFPFVFPTQHWPYQTALAYGTTTSRNPAASYEMFGHQELLRSGAWTGPRLYHVGNAIQDWYGISSQREADSIAGSRAAMDGIAIKQYYQPTRLKRQYLAMAAAKYKLNLTNEDADPLEVIGMLKDGSAGIEHVKSWQDNYRDIVVFMARSGTVWTPTLLVSPPFGTLKSYFANKFALDSADRSMGANLLRRNSKIVSLAKAFEGQLKKYPFHIEKFLEGSKVFSAIANASGLIGVGGHGEIPGLGMHYEMWALKMSGMTNMQVLECATLTGAKALGLERDLGSIEKGKIADLLILDGNPLEDIHNTNTVRYIMKAGVLYDQRTLKEVDVEQLSKDNKQN